MSETNKYFEFKDWRECFDGFRKLNEANPGRWQLVISTHWSTSGYWIELIESSVSATLQEVEIEGAKFHIVGRDFVGKNDSDETAIYYRGANARALMLRVVHSLFIARLNGRQHFGLII